jgi:Mg-chelatase subunit ChlD
VDGLVFEDGNIRVDKTSGVYGDAPVTVQTGGCGDPGQYIQITDKMLQLANFNDIFGPPGQVFVHEWAKYRYGVYEEHGYPGDEKYPMFYIKTSWTVNGEESTLVPNFCLSTDLKFTIQSIDGGNCKYDEMTGLPGSDCVFVPGNAEGLKSSIMALPYFEGNDQFCDDSETYFHDVKLPNKHNALCSMKSTFSVILQHEDFKNFKLNSSRESVPHFELLLPKASASYVMVLDVSGSMKDSNRIGRMRDATVRWVSHDVKDDVPLGIISFSSQAQELFPLQKISQENRPDIYKILQGLVANGGTCLGAALKKGLATLKNGGVERGGVLIFLTDGKQDCDGPDKSDIPNVINDVVAQGVRVLAIAFGISADPRIVELADRTQGKAYFIRDSTGPEEINDALEGALTFQPSTSSDQFDIVIIKKTFANMNNITLPFFIDATIGNNVGVQIDFSGNVNSTIVIGDSTEIFLQSNGVYEKRFDFLGQGMYVISITSSKLIPFTSIKVTSQSRNDTLPIVTRCWTSAGTEKADISSGAKVAIMAQVFQGTNPVIRAKVKAVIERDGADIPEEIALYDQGADPDSTKDDGIYSRYFTSFFPSASDVRYTVKCQVESTDATVINKGISGARQISHQTSHERSLPKRPSPDFPICCGSSTVMEGSELTATGEFGRMETGGMLTIVKSDSVSYPPGTVNDLIAGDLDLNSGTFSIKFTAPGSVLDRGTVEKYTIYYSMNQMALANSSMLEHCNYINETFLAPGSANMTPTEAGSFVKLAVLTEHFTNSERNNVENTTVPSLLYFFRLEASTERSKSASNIARLYMDRYSGNNNWSGQTSASADDYVIFTLLTALLAWTAEIRK